jgi:hypothetical protein
MLSYCLPRRGVCSRSCKPSNKQIQSAFVSCSRPLLLLPQDTQPDRSKLEHISWLFPHHLQTQNMSTPTSTNSAPSSGSSPTPPPLVEPRKYTRFAEADLGSRLANARNLVHTQALPVPGLARQEHRTMVGSVSSDVANSIRQAAFNPPGAPKHGWEKGSYRSPFDYHIPGHTVGGKDTTSSGSLPLVYHSGITSFTPRGSMIPAGARAPREAPSYVKEPRQESNLPCRTVTPGPDVSLNLSPLFSSYVANCFEG